MKIACHFTIPRPPRPELDAAIQDGLQIMTKVGGEINFLYPGTKARIFFPRFMSGFQQLPQLMKLDRTVDIHHVFSNGFYPYPIFSVLRKPVIISNVIGLQQNKPIKFPFILRKIRRFIVPSEHDRQIMQTWGYRNVQVVIPGIDLTKLTAHPPVAVREKFILLMGSAPWTMEQFSTKGVDLLLHVVKELPWLEIIFLWRGLFLKEMVQRIAAAGVQRQVTLITEQITVNDILADVHAAILLARDMEVVKPYPHSILEALAAGKPVIVSDCLQISEFIKNTCSGKIISTMKSEHLKTTITALKNRYAHYCASIRATSLDAFSSVQMVDDYTKLYQQILHEKKM
ncbi:MAG: hypothetical protein DSY80_03785 [Desulfocapsa sp.]|nr:MAG: hypothetical protein DSY80_03785 [Desulfocapsa sp.]